MAAVRMRLVVAAALRPASSGERVSMARPTTSAPTVMRPPLARRMRVRSTSARLPWPGNRRSHPSAYRESAWGDYVASASCRQ
jgi:hypothetical protein